MKYLLDMKVKDILANYSNSNSKLINSTVIENLARILTAGALGGTGKILVLPVDQGFEHGPDKSFLSNPPAYDPLYHIELAIEAGLSAFAAPLGFLECVADHIHRIPCILKINSSNSLNSVNKEPNQAITASVADAVRLGCSAVGMTIYPGSGNFDYMLSQAREIIYEAKSHGLPTVIWSYPRSTELRKDREIALDVVSYAAHIAALIGAHIIKVKVPSITNDTSLYDQIDISRADLRISHIMRAAFMSKRLVIFSGGTMKKVDELLEEIKDIKKGGGSGSIIGRNIFQRPREEALELVNKIIVIYKDEA